MQKPKHPTATAANIKPASTGKRTDSAPCPPASSSKGRPGEKNRSQRGAGHEKIHAIVEAFPKGPMRYLLPSPGPDGSVWTLDASAAQRFSGFEGFDFLGRAHERGVELALLPLDDRMLRGGGQ
ncbi:hypothetical protein [Paraburkholderia fungorum]|uniref:hypothetical protein n=1 Tax=Paraburkholderia fungorum TaxID=134537 RepID=UPI0004033549|nr:hypothetical protein [Paraburkholderia fungorum]PZR48601.1 MAG: hypothetical protein DI523_10565 [Paraburkholderia fungorum]